MMLPFAVCTARHGLDWQYDRSTIAYAELDACRTTLRPMPDFDAGERGYEGIVAIGTRVFVLRCFRALKWDFEGRDAVYLAVTWLPRSDADKINFDALLCLPPFHEPVRESPTMIEAFDLAETEEGREIVEADECVTLRYVRDLDGGRWQRLNDETGNVKGDGNILQRHPVQKTGSHKIVWIALVTVLIVLSWVCIDYFTNGDEVRYDGSRKIAEEYEQANRCKVGVVTNASRAVSMQDDGGTNTVNCSVAP